MVCQSSFAHGLFRAHVAGGAKDFPGLGQLDVRLDVSQSEVRNPEPSGGFNQQVAGLDVAMDDAALVGVVQGFRGLFHQAGGRAVELGPVVLVEQAGLGRYRGDRVR